MSGVLKFRDVWNVLGAMLEQDDLFAQVIRQMREDRGERGGFDDATFRELVEVLGDNIPLDTIQRHITVVSMDRFGCSWDEWYGQLKAFKAVTGHCNVRRADEPHRLLNAWVQTQRNLRRNGLLAEERIQRLDLLKFNWGLSHDRGTTWMDRFHQLAAYKARFGNCDVPKHWPADPSLGRWVRIQRQVNREKRLSGDRIQRLNSLGFKWRMVSEAKAPVSADLAWTERIQQLEEYKARFGNCDVPTGWSENPSLAYWVHYVRRRRGHEQLSDLQIGSLDSLGFVWSKKGDFDEAWTGRLQQLADYKARFNDCNVSANWEEDPSLGVWVNNMRALRKQGRLSTERIAALDGIGFVWGLRNRTVWRLDWNEMFAEYVSLQRAQGTSTPRLNESPALASWAVGIRRANAQGKLTDEQITALNAIGFDRTTAEDRWNSMFAALTDYQRTHGDFNVPNDWPENPKLAAWAAYQQQKIRDETIKAEFRNRLDAIGFLCPLDRTDNWEEMFAALVNFKRHHGHCKVPRKYENDPGLARWVNSQRVGKQKDRLEALKVSRLEAIGFVWNVIAEPWEKMFEQLKQYKKTHGDCDVPTNRPKYKRLASWINRQRLILQALQEGQRKARPYTISRMKRLEMLGFDFGEASHQETRWDENYVALEQYKAQHGDCNVPSQSKENPNLAAWVRVQRTRMKSGALTEQQKDRLNKLGFVWDLHEFNWQNMYEALRMYKLQNGHCWVPSEWPSNSGLARWVSAQRNARISGDLSEKRFRLLDAIGFVWKKDLASSTEIGFVGSLHDQKWQQMFDELVRYKEQFGNCDIPINWPINPRLASWVSSQRTAKKNGKLPANRFQLLDEQGFLWQKKNGRRSLESNGGE